MHLVHAVSRSDVLVGEDGEDGLAAAQTCADGAVPVAARGNVVRIQPDGEAVPLQVRLQLVHELRHCGLATVANEQLLRYCSASSRRASRAGAGGKGSHDRN